MLEYFLNKCLEKGIKPKGAIYVGAHHGNEVTTLKEFGFDNIYLVEGNPEIFELLKTKFSADYSVKLKNAIISDKEEEVKFNITTMDQSSSILELKIHQTIYPGIKKAKEIITKSETIDKLIKTEKNNYNFLFLDIQGAELKALNGAKETLKSIDVVISEVNTQELYDGCPLIEEIDAFLFDNGFIRVASDWRYSQYWGDALYIRSSFLSSFLDMDPIRRGSIYMSNFTRNGRFGNQILQYIFVNMYAMRAGCTPILPHWPDGEAFFENYFENYKVDKNKKIKQKISNIISKYIFKIHHGHKEMVNNIIELTPRINLQDLNKARNFINVALMPRNIDISGYFDFPEQYSVHKELIKNHLKFKNEIEEILGEWLFKLTEDGKRKLIVAHLRRGDFAPFSNGIRTDRFIQVPFEWSQNKITELLKINPHARVIIVSDDKNLREEAKKIYGNWHYVDKISEKITDFYLLKNADIMLAAAISTYSLTAGMLADDKQEVWIANLETEQYEPAEIWAKNNKNNIEYSSSEEIVRNEIMNKDKKLILSKYMSILENTIQLFGSVFYKKKSRRKITIKNYKEILKYWLNITNPQTKVPFAKDLISYEITRSDINKKK